MLSDYNKLDLIRTPLPMLQIMTGGGVRFSTLVELYGSNKAGKSTTCYQTAGYFLEDYGDEAELKILDSETSADFIRLLSFNIDTMDNRVEIVPATYIEDGMLTIFKWIEKLPPNKKMMIIWDTLSASPTRSAYDSATTANKAEDLKMYAGGMTDRPRIIKHYLRQVMSMLYGKKISVWMPNQVFASLSQYGPAVVAGEGTALQHDKHYSLLFARRDSDVTTTDDSCVAVQTVSKYSLRKSKFSPEFEPVPLYIDNTLGGLIDERLSLFHTALQEKMIIQNGGWYKLDPNGSSFHMKDLVENDDAYRSLVNKLIIKYRSKYPTVDRVYLVQGYPPLPKDIVESSKSKRSLVSFKDCFECSYSQSEVVGSSEVDELESSTVESINKTVESSEVIDDMELDKSDSIL